VQLQLQTVLLQPLLQNLAPFLVVADDAEQASSSYGQ